MLFIQSCLQMRDISYNLSNIKLLHYVDSSLHIPFYSIQMGFNVPLIFYFVDATKNSYAGGIKKGTALKYSDYILQSCTECVPKWQITKVSVPSMFLLIGNALLRELCPECP